MPRRIVLGRAVFFALCMLALWVSSLSTEVAAVPLWKQGVQGNFKLVRDSDNAEFIEWMSWSSLVSRMGVFNRKSVSSPRATRNRKVFWSSSSGTLDHPQRRIRSDGGMVELSPLDKPVLLFFHQPKCEACAGIRGEMKASAEFELMSQYFHLVSVDHIDELVDHPYPVAGSDDAADDAVDDHSTPTHASRRNKLPEQRNARGGSKSTKETAAEKLDRVRQELDTLDAMSFDGGLDDEADGNANSKGKSWIQQYMPQSDYIPRLLFLYPNNGTVSKIVNRNSDPDHLHFYYELSSLLKSMKEALHTISGIDNTDFL